MPRKAREVISEVTPVVGGIETGQIGVDDAPHVNGVVTSSFAEEEYPTRATYESGSDELTPKPAGKKRGPKPGSKRKSKFTSETSPKIDIAIDKLTQGVAFIHCTLANVLHIPELEMGADEAGNVVAASIDVLSQYDLTPDPKTVAWLNLTMVLATVYGTRVMAFNARQKLTNNQTVQSEAA